jgi:hypothetical protein
MIHVSIHSLVPCVSGCCSSVSAAIKRTQSHGFDGDWGATADRDARASLISSRIDQPSKAGFINKRELRAVHVIGDQTGRYRDNATGGRAEQIGQIVLAKPASKSDALFSRSPIKLCKIKDLAG